MDIESDVYANIDSDHMPVIGVASAKLKGTRHANGRARAKYDKRSQEQRDRVNFLLGEAFENTTTHDSVVKKFLETADLLP